jgi:hypothetical protein
MAFDSGMLDEKIVLDSSFVAVHPCLMSGNSPDSTGLSGSAWGGHGVNGYFLIRL